MPRLLERVKQLPRGVLAFAALVVLYDIAALLVNWRWFHAHPPTAALWFLLSFGVLAALVLWRQRWAWWLAFIGPALWLVSPAWENVFDRSRTWLSSCSWPRSLRPRCAGT